MNAPSTPSRKLQVDFFRGIALMIIFINHMPLNDWSLYTPSRFGLSDSAETFVFLSGFAAALAYGRCFQRVGLGVGTIRIVRRCGQLYAAHLASFILLAAIAVLGNRWMAEPDYIARLNIAFFFDRTREALIGLFSLRYVPNMFDILPLYLVIMVWIPVVWALSRLHIALALGFPILVYGCMWRFGWELPADPLGDRPWYFNPFAWQLMFFTGFALGAGWLRVPGPNRGLIGLCLIFVIISIPLAHEPTFRQMAFLQDLHTRLEPLLDKNHLGILRWAHFLALAYLMNRCFERNPHWLQKALPRWIAGMGSQSLPVFVLCTALSFVGGMVLDWTDHEAVSVAGVNLAGLGLMLLAAAGLNWLDAKPWKPAGADAAQTPGSRSAAVFDERPRLWARQAVTVSALALLATAPWLLMQQDGENGEAWSTVATVVSNHHHRPLPVNEDLRPSATEDRIEWQDGI